MKVLYIMNAGNQVKIDAVKQVLSSLPLPGTILFQPRTLFQNRDVRPLRKTDTIYAATMEAKNLLKEFPKNEIPGYDYIASIGIQKGTNILDDEDLKFFCETAIETSGGRKRIGESDLIHLPSEIRTLVRDQNMSLYSAFGKVLGEEVESKKISLYEKLTGRSEIELIVQSVRRALIKAFD